MGLPNLYMPISKRITLNANLDECYFSMWLWFMIVAVAAILFGCAGAYMMYSAITGKGIPEPDRRKAFGRRIQFKARGLIGFVFFIVGRWNLLGLTSSFITPLRP